jgi:hypothetical protein
MKVNSASTDYGQRVRIRGTVVGSGVLVTITSVSEGVTQSAMLKPDRSGKLPEQILDALATHAATASTMQRHKAKI